MGPRFSVILIREAAPLSRCGFHPHGMAGRAQRLDAIRRQAYAELMIFDLFRHADDHGSSLG